MQRRKGTVRKLLVTTLWKKRFQLVMLSLLLSYIYSLGLMMQQMVLVEDINVRKSIIRHMVTQDPAGDVVKTRDKINNDPVAENISGKNLLATRDEAKNKTPFLVEPTKSKANVSLPDNFVPKVYKAGNWDGAPIVVKEYKLLFFTQGKVRAVVSW